ncbi:hypothetical protein SUGI_0113020 [Cryptomeria japonica]|nr:hypothetical protein SUGI_0113020 [Cryptomeria japonica]
MESRTGELAVTWQSVEKTFKQVQSILDMNRLLITEIKRNHDSKVPAGLSKNVQLIRELNENITQVVRLYTLLSSTFVKNFSPLPQKGSLLPSGAGHKRLRSSG